MADAVVIALAGKESLNENNTANNKTNS